MNVKGCPLVMRRAEATYRAARLPLEGRRAPRRHPRGIEALKPLGEEPHEQRQPAHHQTRVGVRGSQGQNLRHDGVQREHDRPSKGEYAVAGHEEGVAKSLVPTVESLDIVGGKRDARRARCRPHGPK